MTGNFKFKVSANMRYGAGESARLGEEMKELGYSNTAAIVDKGVFDHPRVRKALESVTAAGIRLDVVKNPAAEPTYGFLESFRNNFKAGRYDSLIGIGGGSTLDLAKGIAVLLTNDGPAISFRGFPKLRERPLPVVALPTTAGTGSEVTYNAVFTDEKEKRKLGINSEYNYPVLAILDPLLTMDCPVNVTVSSGMDAMTHTLESFVHKNHTVVSRALSREAFRLLYNNLTKVLSNMGDVEIRGRLQIGSYLAAMALINSGSGPAAALSYPLGVHYKVPHGIAGAIFLPSVTEYNVRKGYTDYDELHDLIEGSDKGLTPDAKNRAFAGYIKELAAKLHVPASLSGLGLKDRDVEFMIDQYDMLKNGIAQNPIGMAKEDIAAMLRSLNKETERKDARI
ncbi:MAG: iron-containing alcohol dehydrogenase [Candidatus Omnitrophota bacterium]